MSLNGCRRDPATLQGKCGQEPLADSHPKAALFRAQVASCSGDYLV